MPRRSQLGPTDGAGRGAGTISVDRTTLHEPTLHETRASGAPRLLAHVRAGLRLLALLSTSGARCFCSSHSLALRHLNQSLRDGPVRRMHGQADESHAARAVQMEFATKHAFARPRFPPSQCWPCFLNTINLERSSRAIERRPPAMSPGAWRRPMSRFRHHRARHPTTGAQVPDVR